LEECQGDDLRQHRGFGEVDHARVVMLEWVHPVPGSEMRIAIPDGAEPVLFRRHLIRLFFNDSNTQTTLPAIYGLGWQLGKHEAYLFKLPDGSVLVSTDRNAV
jgi:hypothetical protein